MSKLLNRIPPSLSTTGYCLVYIVCYSCVLAVCVRQKEQKTCSGGPAECFFFSVYNRANGPRVTMTQGRMLPYPRAMAEPDEVGRPKKIR